MKVIEPSIELIYPVYADEITVLKTLESIGRVCYKSEDKINNDSCYSFIEKIIKAGHNSILEHYTISIRVICDRGVSHEIVRHRIASYAQESTRYCNYYLGKFGNEITVIKPCFWNTEDLEESCTSLIKDEKMKVWKSAMDDIETYYMKLISLGATPQEARSVLPNSLKTEIIMTMNLREWRHFLNLRTSKAAHPQMQEIASKILLYFKAWLPSIFKDIKEEI